MSKKPEALRLADELEMWTRGEPAAAELRRLHDMNAELLAVLKLVESLPGFEPNEHYGVAVKAAIAKAEGGTNEL